MGAAVLDIALRVLNSQKLHVRRSRASRWLMAALVSVACPRSRLDEHVTARLASQPAHDFPAFEEQFLDGAI